MGIKGLRKFLINHPKIKHSSEIILPESTLLIDSFGLLFYIIRNHPQERNLSLGNYELLNQLFVEEISRLLSFGIKLVVVEDGKKTRFKEECIKDRRRKRSEEWIGLVDFLDTGKIANNTNLPVCLLAFDQFKEALALFNIPTIRAESESDEEIAKICAQKNLNGKETHFCYGNDSDFIAFKDCPYIEFGDLTPLAGHVKGCQANRVWRRKHTAQLLGLSEPQMIEFFLFLGNDYTLAHQSKINSIIPEDFSKLETRKPKEILDFVILLGKNYQIPTSEDEDEDVGLRDVVNFSRSLYNLEDVSMYPYDTIEALEADIKLDSTERNKIAQLVLSLNGNIPDIYKFLSECASTCCSFIKENNKYIPVIAEMISSVKNKDIVFPEPARYMNYNDYLPAYFFQLVYRECKKHLISIPSPKDIFNINAYAALISKLPVVKNKNKNKKAVPIVPTQQLNTENTDGNNDNDNPRNTPLPIDNHRDEILRKIEKDRVVIIHGETGCGKSSRLPLFLLEDLTQKKRPCKIIVSQPRRIAAVNLYRRLAQTLGDKVGLRMGFGVHIGDDTPITFVTTGILIRYFSMSPEKLASFTHIIIDEVHERSIDNDVSCFFVRSFLKKFSHLRVILMSATIEHNLYKSYFNQFGNFGDMNCLSVGVRRFPVSIKYAENIFEEIKENVRMLKLIQSSRQLADSTRLIKGLNDDISATVIKSQYTVVEEIICNIIPPGSGVLVFVSGMADIVELNEKFELRNASMLLNEEIDLSFKVFVIHSDIPLEEQEAAFLPVNSNEIKIILATNAAESSITIPDADYVICLGMCKSVRYNQYTHKKFLGTSWISQASAIQRAGRTGRVRPGFVYRLYSQDLYDKFSEHEEPEIRRTPMQDVILNLRSTFEKSHDFEGVKPILNQLIEPPDISNVIRSFEHLYDMGMISSPDDHGCLTKLGHFSSRLPIGAELSRLIGFGIALGVKEEAIVIAAALTLPKSPFQIASPFIHKDPDVFNEIVVNTTMHADYFDGGAYSEPIMYLRAFLEYLEVPKQKKNSWLYEHCLVQTRFKTFRSNILDITRKVNTYLELHGLLAPTPVVNHGYGSNENNDNVFSREEAHMDMFFKSRLVDLDDKKLNLLRLILTWSFSDNILIMRPLKKKPKVEIEIENDELVDNHLTKLFPSEIKWELIDSNGQGAIYSAKLSKIQQNASTKLFLKELLNIYYRKFTDANFPVIITLIDQRSNIPTVTALVPKNNRSDNVNDFLDMIGFQASSVSSFSNSNTNEKTGDKTYPDAWPPSLKAYAARAFNICHNDEQKKYMELQIKSNIDKIAENGGLIKHKWEKEPVPLLPSKKKCKELISQLSGLSISNEAEISKLSGVSTSSETDIDEYDDDNFEMFELDCVSQADVSTLSNLNTQIFKVQIHMVITDSKHSASIILKGIDLSVSHLEPLFFGANTYDGETSIKKKKANGGMKKNKVLKFESPTIDKNINYSLLAPKRDYSTHSSLLYDIPKGIRLLNSIRTTYKDKKIIFWTTPKTKNNNFQTSSEITTPMPGAPVGSVQWQAQKSQNQANDPNDTESNLKFKLSISNDLTYWSMLRAGGNVQLKQPIVSLAQPTETLPYYGVSYIINEYQYYLEGKLKIAKIASGVSLLPVGSRWLGLALACLNSNKDPDYFDELYEDSDDSMDYTSSGCGNYPLDQLRYNESSSTLSLCLQVSERLYSEPDMEVQKDPELIRLINEIYQEWYINCN